MISGRRLRLLIVDDSAIVRRLIRDAVRDQAEVEVVGEAGDPYEAREQILKVKPDVLTLDIEMPRMDGLTFLGKLMAHHRLPVIIISSLTQAGSAASIEALRLGAVQVLAKPSNPREIQQLREEIREALAQLRVAPSLNLAPPRPAAPPAPLPSAKSADGLLLIGASTGGPAAIESLLLQLPADTPPTFIVQHMPATFTAAFAERLNRLVPMRVIEAKGEETAERGTAYLAPGGKHLLVEKFGLRLRTRLSDEPQLHHQRPAVDRLFASAARLTGLPMVAVLLTGMGADGADGMLALRKAGAETIAQDEHSSVVFGMPKEAIARGGAGEIAALPEIPGRIFTCFERLAKAPVLKGRT